MTLSDAEQQDLTRVACLLADAARVESLKYFRKSNLALENKLAGGFDPVTVADRAAERAMRDILASERPDDAIFGEEYGQTPGTSGLTWILDPIDGTRGYMTGTPTWGTLIAVSDAAGPVMGVIDQPYIGERFIGGWGQARFEGPHGQGPIRTRLGAGLAEAALFSTFPEVGTKDEEAAFRRVSQQVRLTRYGMDCYGYALVAAGQVDLVIEAGLNAYDVQAPIAVIEAAGGIVTNWQGGPAHQGGQVLAAANAEIHREALDLLQAG